MAAAPTLAGVPAPVHWHLRPLHSVPQLGQGSRRVLCPLSKTSGVLTAAAVILWKRQSLRSRCHQQLWLGHSIPKRSVWPERARTLLTATDTNTAMGGKEQRPFGSWESPITAKFITSTSVGLGSAKCAEDGSLYWLEARPLEGGRQVVCRKATADEQGSERGGVDVTPAGSNARTRVHEYGGGAHLLGPENDGVIYSNFSDQRLYWVKKDGTVHELTPPSAFEEDARFRFADGVIDVARHRLICIREDHTDPKPANVVNTICAVALDGSGSMDVLVSGCDFYAAPRLSPDGTQLAYICWNHPNMPWDATELQVANLDADTGAVLATDSICGAAGHTSVLQPLWSPEGILHFVADTTGWWNIYRCDKPEPVNIFLLEAEFSGAAPGWALGGQNYCFLKDGRLVTCYSDSKTGASRLIILKSSEGSEVAAEEFDQECLPRNVGSPCASPDGKTLYFMGGDAATPSGIYKWALPAADREGDSELAPAEMIVCSMSDDMRIDPAFVSVPELVKFPTGANEFAYGYHYPPTNPKFEGPDDARPPLLVKAHGGPTACARVSLSPAIQFWTSRGFAVLDVDYRGSTGYGRSFRERLNGNWGVVDIEDVCAGAEHLVREGLASPKQLAIDGGSAGGFTTLGALTFRDVFTAGCSLYGVADLSTLATDTHKFESRYLDGLVGKYPQEQGIYDARAPIKHVEQLSCPILLLQGEEDKIVPPNQAEMMYEAAKTRGLPCALKVYPGEQHGFRRSENVEDALNSELVFFARIFGFQAAGSDLPHLAITNLDAESDRQDIQESTIKT